MPNLLDILIGLGSGMAGDPGYLNRTRVQQQQFQMQKEHQSVQNLLTGLHLAQVIKQMKQENEPAWNFPEEKTQVTGEELGGPMETYTQPGSVGPTWGTLQKLKGVKDVVPSDILERLGLRPEKKYQAIGTGGLAEITPSGARQVIQPPEQQPKLTIHGTPFPDKDGNLTVIVGDGKTFQPVPVELLKSVGLGIPGLPPGIPQVPPGTTGVNPLLATNVPTSGIPPETPITETNLPGIPVGTSQAPEQIAQAEMGVAPTIPGMNLGVNIPPPQPVAPTPLPSVPGMATTAPTKLTGQFKGAPKTKSAEQIAEGVVREKLRAQGITREPTNEEIQKEMQGGKTVSEEELVRQDLRDRLKREPTAGEVRKEIQKGRIELAEAQGIATGRMLKPETKQAVSEMLARGEIMPSMLPARGIVAAQAMEIFKQAKEINPNLNLAAMEAEYKAGTAGLTRLSTLYQTVSVARKTADRHGKTVLELSKKVDKLGVPAIDRWIVGGRKEIAGDQDASNLNIAIYAFDKEFTRYLESMTMTGQLSQQESERMRNVFHVGMNKQQILGGIQTISRLMSEKDKSFNEQFGIVKRQLKTLGSEVTTEENVPTGGIVIDPSQFKPKR